MAGLTGSSEYSSVGKVLEGSGRMAALVMALLTEPRSAYSEQSDIVASVGYVAVQTVLPDWRMLIQERSPFVRMAAVAALVDAVLRDQLFGDGPVNIVATGALELAFPDRHVRPVLEHGGLDRMALAAEVKLGGGLQLRAFCPRGLDGMAGCAGKVADFMWASLPEEPPAL
jgi:hypothetical protein